MRILTAKESEVEKLLNYSYRYSRKGCDNIGDRLIRQKAEDRDMQMEKAILLLFVDCSTDERKE